MNTRQMKVKTVLFYTRMRHPPPSPLAHMPVSAQTATVISITRSSLVRVRPVSAHDHDLPVSRLSSASILIITLSQVSTMTSLYRIALIQSASRTPVPRKWLVVEAYKSLRVTDYIQTKERISPHMRHLHQYHLLHHHGHEARRRRQELPSLGSDDEGRLHVSEDAAFTRLTSARPLSMHVENAEVENIILRLRGPYKMEEKNRLRKLRGDAAYSMLDALQKVCTTARLQHVPI
jgi:hypothetical protein